ncbi:MAG TPA: Asp-tRNA(Asn)/Glu-tRNA(Gln) amidotransferase subunit GatC [Gemmatimonadales bacterium]|jgi:aspartyl-tRNA(Asn)/glutamyl-tRNA(Gln) amidotransferase subunit C|nr:Asp-tRNA(Asn)/Glu-tRNA(Gln) amidotransferase subunit GatC [Gemmatimonadales bacterium]
MSIGREQVLHVAKLAEIGVDEADLPKLVEQLDRIVGYVEQLNQVPEAPAEPFLAGPTAAPLRDDVVRPVPLERPPADFAPEFRDGFFLVPRHGAMEDL